MEFVRNMVIQQQEINHTIYRSENQLK